MVGGLRKVKPEIQVIFNSPIEKKKREYKDKFPKHLKTMEAVKKKYGAVIWCQFTECKFNEEIDGLQRTTGTILKNRTYNPINEQEHVWATVCNRGEVAIKYDEVTTASGAKFKVPSCFTTATKRTGHIDFSRFLQSDGSPIGGNIDSQHVSDAGYSMMDSNNIYGM